MLILTKRTRTCHAQQWPTPSKSEPASCQFYIQVAGARGRLKLSLVEVMSLGQNPNGSGSTNGNPQYPWMTRSEYTFLTLPYKTMGGRKRSGNAARKSPAAKRTRRTTRQVSPVHSRSPSPTSSAVEEETAEDELGEGSDCNQLSHSLCMKARLRREWQSNIYGFFKPDVVIKLDKTGKRGHEFHCLKGGCTSKVVRWLDKGDSRSTSNLRRHAKRCLGEEVLAAADGMKETQARMAVAAFVRSGVRSYSTRQHTKAEIRYVQHIELGR